jgi:hypothetical protein
MSLELYLRNGWIHTHATSRDEIANLLAIAERDIAQSQTPGLGAEWRFDIAYNAALQLATAVLAAAGYQAERQNKHQRTLECLAFTIPLDARTIAFLDTCRRKRHVAVYDRIDAISQKEAAEMIAAAQNLRRLTRAWLKHTHPALLS